MFAFTVNGVYYASNILSILRQEHEPYEVGSLALYETFLSVVLSGTAPEFVSLVCMFYIYHAADPRPCLGEKEVAQM